LKLSLGISEVVPGWKLILRQIGIPFHLVNINNTINPDEYPVLIISSYDKEKSRKNILHYLQSGGSLLLEADIAKSILDFKNKQIYIKYLCMYNNPVFSFSLPVDLNKRCSVSLDAQYVENQKGQKSVAIKKVGKGTVVILPSGFISSLLDFRITRKNFPTEFGERLPSERVSKVSKGGIRYLVQTSLQYLFHCCKLPFLHLWYFPDGAKSLFSFRVDTDFSKKQEVEKLYQICRKNKIRATWFIETKTQADWIDFYQGMQDQNIGYHGYRHRIFPDKSRNLQDFKQGLSIFKKNGILPKGYAAPYGEWNPTLAQIVQEKGFLYSSEFGIAYDDFPFLPYLNKSFSSVLQIPIHPISIGSLRRARHTHQDMLNYYLRIMEIKRAAYQPIIFYHHPCHGCLAIFEQLFKKVVKENIPTITMEDYSSWWKRRIDIKWDPEIVNGQLKFNSFYRDPSFWIRASFPSGDEILTPITKTDPLLKGEYKLMKEKNVSDYDAERLRKFNWRMLVNDIENYWGKLRK